MGPKSTSKFRAILSGLASLVMLALLAAQGFAQDLVVNADPAFGGYYRPGRWSPVVVSIQNTPSSGKAGDSSLDFNGVLTVESMSKTSRKGTYEFSREVSVPAFSTQRFLLYVKFAEPPDPSETTLHVRTEGGRLIKSQKIDIQPLDRKQVLIATVSDETRRINYPFPRASAINFFTQASLSTRQFPEHWAGYDSVDVLVFPSWPEGKLLPAQLKALKDWVIMGGTLVFLGGSNSPTYAGSAVPADLLPVTLETSSPYEVSSVSMNRLPDSESLEGKNAVLVSNVTNVAPDAEALYTAPDGNAVVVRRAIGRGQVLFFGTDFQTNTPQVRDLLQMTWMGVMPVKNVLSWEWGFHRALEGTRTVTGRAARPPSAILIILICILYTAIVGPINFHLLGKKNKVQWAWLTVPVIVFIFSGLIYGFGSWTKGGSTIARELSILRSVQGQKAFDELSTVSVFVPEADEYFVMPLQDDQAASDADQWYETNYGSIARIDMVSITVDTGTGLALRSTPPRQVVRDNKIQLARWPMKTFDTSQFEVRGPRELEGAIEADLAYTQEDAGFRITGTITNNTGVDLQTSGLFFAGRGYDMGPLKNGETKTFADNDLAGSATAQSGVSGRIWVDPETTILDSIFPEGTNLESDESIGATNLNNLFNRMFHPEFNGRLLPPLNGRMYLIGMAEDKDLTVRMNMERNMGIRSIAMMVELNPKVSGPFHCGERMNQLSICDAAGNIDGPQLVTNENDLIALRDGEAVFAVDTPFRQADLFATAISPFMDVSASERYPFQLGVYNFETHQFDRMTNDGLMGDGQYITPYSGRAFVLLKATEKADAAQVVQHENIIRRLGFSIGGTVE